MHVAAPEPKAETLRIVLDRQLCQGHAICTGESPSHFKLAPDGTLQLLKEEVSDADLVKVERAVKYCPNQALRIARE